MPASSASTSWRASTPPIEIPVASGVNRRHFFQSPARAVARPAAMNPVAESSPPMPKIAPAIAAPVSSTRWSRTRIDASSPTKSSAVPVSARKRPLCALRLVPARPLRAKPSTAMKTSTCKNAPKIDMGTSAALEKG